MIICSKSFDNNGMLPQKHTGFGEDISPEFTIIDKSETSDKKVLVEAMQGHILAEAKITGKYQRGR